MISVTFVTGNALKASIARDILRGYGIEVVQEKIETPEIQSSDGAEISAFSASHAARALGRAVVKTDVSYAIPALNGFPGPYVKFINQWLSSHDLLRLMRGKEDRTLIITEFLTYADPDGKTATFQSVTPCRIADRVIDDTQGSAFDRILIRPGFNIPQNLMTAEQLRNILHDQVEVWHALGRHLGGAHG